MKHNNTSIFNFGKTPWQVYCILIAVGSILAFSFVSLTWTDGDEGRYVALAESFASGNGQSMIYLPVPQPEWLTPPIYPMLLGLVYRLSDFSVLSLKIVSLTCYLAFLPALLFLYMKLRPTSPTINLLTAIAGGCGVYVLSFSWQILSETMYLAVSVLWLCLFAKNKMTPARAFSAGLIAGMSLLIRPVAITLIGAGILHLLWRRKFRWVTYFIMGVLVVNLYTCIRTQQVIGVPFAYLAHYKQYGASPAHGHALFNSLRTLYELLPSYLLAIPDMLFFSLFSEHCLLCHLHIGWFVMPGKLILLIVIIVGLITRLRKPTAMEFYFLIYLCLISTYNPARYLTQGVFLPQYRYLICMLPLAAFYLATGWLYVISHVFHRSVQIRTRIVYVGLGLFAIYVLSTSAIAGFLRTKHEWPLRGRPIWDPVRLEQTDNTANHALAQYMRTAFWIRDNLSTNIVIASRKPEHTYLFSGRKSFRYDGVDVHGSNVWDIMTRQQQYGELIILQDAFPPDTVYGQDRMTMLEPLMREKEHQLELLYESAPPTTRVWRVHSFNQ